MSKAYFYFLIAVFVFGCKKTTSIPANVSEDKTIVESGDLHLKKPRLRLLTLEKAVLNSLDNIIEFTQIQGKIDTINTKVNLVDYREKLIDLNQEIIDFEDLIPSTLSKNEILTRTSLLRTYTLLLENSLTNASGKDSLQVERHIVKLLEAYNSLTFQLNETQNKITKEFEEELSKKGIARDTLLTDDVAPLF